MYKSLPLYTFFITLFLATIPVLVCGQTQALTANNAEGKIVNQISIRGLREIKPIVVQRELLIQKGQTLSLSAFNESIQRLNNLRLFSQIDTQLIPINSKEIKIIINLEEIWTTIPIFKINQGGDTTHLVAGVYDINLLGRYFEFGAQYERWNGKPGGVIWFRDPRFMNHHIRLGADIWSVKRPKDLYKANGTQIGSYVLYQRRLNLFVDSELANKFTLGFGLEIDKDRFLEPEFSNNLPTDITSQLLNDSETTTVFGRVYFKFGRINYDRYLLEGALSELNSSHAISQFGSDDNFYRLEWDNRVFWRLPKQANVGLRLKLGATNSDSLQHLFYVGGFEHIRGYFDGQLRGKQYWQANIEYRLPVYKRPWLVLQSNVFLDMAQINIPRSDLEPEDNDIFYSTGIGLRIISPKIYRFIGRFDLVLDTSHPATSRFSFGVQQYF